MRTSNGALSALRDRIQRELRGQLGRSFKSFRLWQDKEAIAPGKLWEAEIRAAVEHSAFFIPIITPTVVKSPFCKFELDLFLARERALGRSDLVFPILYIRVPSLEDGGQQDDPVLSTIASRQYVDWREFRQLDVNSTEVKQKVEFFASMLSKHCMSRGRRRRSGRTGKQNGRRSETSARGLPKRQCFSSILAQVRGPNATGLTTFKRRNS